MDILSPGQWIAIVALGILGFLIASRRKQLVSTGQQAIEQEQAEGLQALEEGRLEDAAKFLFSVYDRANKLREGKDAAVTMAMLHLSRLHLRMEKWDEAEHFAAEASLLLENRANPHSELFPEALDVINEVHLQRGDIEKAEENLHRSLQFVRQRYGERSAETARRLADIADFLVRQGREADAISYYQESLALQDKLGQAGPAAATPQLLLKLGVTMIRSGRHHDAAPALKRGLTWIDRFHGPDSYESAPFLDAIAIADTYAGNYNSAADLLGRAVKLREERYGPDHIEVGAALAQLADVLRKVRRYDEAQAAATRALRIQEHADDFNRHSTLETLAQIKFECGEHTDADEYFRNALLTLRQAVGEENLEVAEYLEKHATIKKRLGEFDIARTMNDQAGQIRKRWAEHHC